VITCTQSTASNVRIAVPIIAALQLSNSSIITSQGSIGNITINSFSVYIGTMNPGNNVTISYNASFIPIYNPAPSSSNVTFNWDAISCSSNFLNCNFVYKNRCYWKII
jgi:protoporphyrinogen oxidase